MRQTAGQPPTGLGHRRLAIIDLSAAGLQPMTVEPDAGGGMQTGLTLIFNGEIYNYRELRAELVAAGHRFRTADRFGSAAASVRARRLRDARASERNIRVRDTRCAPGRAAGWHALRRSVPRPRPARREAALLRAYHAGFPVRFRNQGAGVRCGYVARHRCAGAALHARLPVDPGTPHHAGGGAQAGTGHGTAGALRQGSAPLVVLRHSLQWHDSLLRRAGAGACSWRTTSPRRCAGNWWRMYRWAPSFPAAWTRAPSSR